MKKFLTLCSLFVILFALTLGGITVYAEEGGTKMDMAQTKREEIC